MSSFLKRYPSHTRKISWKNIVFNRLARLLCFHYEAQHLQLIRTKFLNISKILYRHQILAFLKVCYCIKKINFRNVLKFQIAFFLCDLISIGNFLEETNTSTFVPMVYEFCKNSELPANRKNLQFSQFSKFIKVKINFNFLNWPFTWNLIWYQHIRSCFVNMRNFLIIQKSHEILISRNN